MADEPKLEVQGWGRGIKGPPSSVLWAMLIRSVTVIVLAALALPTPWLVTTFRRFMTMLPF